MSAICAHPQGIRVHQGRGTCPYPTLAARALTSRFVLALRSTLWVLLTVRGREMWSVRFLCCKATPGTWGQGRLGLATPQQAATWATYTGSR